MDKEMFSKVTVVIPAKNEEHSLADILDQALKVVPSHKVVVIVDEEGDRSADIAVSKGVAVFTCNRRGKGAAIKFAVEAIQSEILLFMDADGSHNPLDIPALIRPIADGKADLVVGSRIKGGSEELSGTVYNRLRFIGNILSNAVINLFWANGSPPITDSQNGFRAIRKEAALNLVLREDDFSIEQEMVIKCLKAGLKIREIPSFEFKRKFGKSKINLMAMLPRYIRCFIRNF